MWKARFRTLYERYLYCLCASRIINLSDLSYQVQKWHKRQLLAQNVVLIDRRFDKCIGTNE